MKKKLLISAVLALMFVCLFAIAVGATTYNYSDENGNVLYSATAELKANGFELIQTESGNLAKTDADGNSLTWYVVGDNEEAGVRNITVKSIKTADAGVITDGKFTFAGDVTADNVVSVNFFGMDIKTFDSALFMTTAKTTPSDSTEYCRVANGKYLLFLYLPKTLTEVPNQFCYRTSLRVLEWEDNSVLYTTVPQNAFQFMANLKSLTIPEGIETLSIYSFRECLSLTYLKFPSTMTRLEHDVFYHSIAFETVIFGENMTFIGYLNSDYNTVYYSWNIKNFQIKYMYVPNTVNITGSSFDTYRGKNNNYINVNRNLVFLFVGTLEEAGSVANCSADKHFKNAIKNKTIEYEDYISNEKYYDTEFNGHILVYNVPKCVAYGHKYTSAVTEPTCTTVGYTTYTCTVCGDTYIDGKVDAKGHRWGSLNVVPATCEVDGYITIECGNCGLFCKSGVDEEADQYLVDFPFISVSKAMGHSYDVSDISYPNGYGEAGVKVSTCETCGGTKEATADALFAVLGFSASEELGGITVSYRVNNEAIADYEAITGIDITYGVFAASAEGIGNEDAINADGTPMSGVISKDATSYNLETFNLKLMGFETEDLMQAKIVMGAYVIENASSVSYVQPAKSTTEGVRYYAVSFNGLIGKEE